jgi:hypothetical protein
MQHVIRRIVHDFSGVDVFSGDADTQLDRIAIGDSQCTVDEHFVVLHVRVVCACDDGADCLQHQATGGSDHRSPGSVEGKFRIGHSGAQFETAFCAARYANHRI